jgi:hypothetical protein
VSGGPTCFVVQGVDGEVLGAFVDRQGAEAYAAARSGRRVRPVPLVEGTPDATTVHTRWVQVEADGSVRSQRDSYAWYAALDQRDGLPPTADIEEYSDGPCRRLLCVGTDAGLLNVRLDEALQRGARAVENVALHEREA